MTVTEFVSPRAATRARALARALRPHQWVKNLLLFVPVVLDHKLFHAATMARAATAFVAFCCAASSAYVLNDILDRDADRNHPVKRARPFASGQLSPGLGIFLVPALLALGFAVSWSTLPVGFIDLLAVYVVLTTAYSVYLKRVAVVDVLLLAGLYTLRVLGGVAASEVRFSTWLLAFAMFLFLSLALYINSEQVLALYREPLLLWLICPLLLFWISRMWLMAHRGRIFDDPIVATVRDPASYLLGALVALVLYFAL
jgi:4-hydroxybenzoate polyprenyltransferase